jgi:hypothetical protein
MSKNRLTKKKGCANRRPKRSKRVLSDKAAAQRQHARNRALERFGKAFNRQDLDTIASQIEQGKALQLYQQSNRVGVYLLRYKQDDYTVVYDLNRKTVVTFLPERPKTYSEELFIEAKKKLDNLHVV